MARFLCVKVMVLHRGQTLEKMDMHLFRQLMGQGKTAEYRRKKGKGIWGRVIFTRVGNFYTAAGKESGEVCRG
jgi:hypothetical protein